MERLSRRFDAVGRSRRRALPFGESGAGDLKRHVQEDSEVGHKALRGEFVEFPQELHVDAASVALVGEGGVAEAVAEHPLPTRERGFDHVRHHLRARGEEQQNLRARDWRVLQLFAHKTAD